MKKILFLTVLGIAVMQMASAQFIDVVGKGVIDVPDNTNPALIIPDIDHVEYVIVEAAGHFVNQIGTPQNIPQNVTFSSGVPKSAGFNEVDEIHSNFVNKLTNPKTVHNWVVSFGYYKATFQKSEISAGTITLNKNGQGKSIISFYAYIYRKDGTVNKYSLLSEKRVYLYRSNDPAEYEFSLDPVPEDRNIKITIPFSDNYEPAFDQVIDDHRVAVVSLLIGNQEIHKETFNINELNTNFVAKTIEFDNVPGEVTRIKIAISSPVENSDPGSDSFIAGMPVLTVEQVGECADCKGGITALKLKYTGATVAQKISVYKDKVDKKNLLAEFTKIKNNESIEFYGKEKNKTMGAKIIIVISGNKKYTEIHTSCSKDIYAGMQFGVFQIVSGYSKDGGPLCFYEEPPCANCKGGVTMLELKYNGDMTGKTINIYKGKIDKKSLLNYVTALDGNLKFNGTLGTNIIITINGKKHTEIHTSCSKPIYVGMTFGDFEIVSGASKDGGPLCPKPGDNGNCGTCKGGVTKLLLKYHGTGAGLSVKSKNVKIDATFDANNNTILIYNKGDKLGTEIYITVDGTTTSLHTSCSKPVYAGLEFGKFKILSGTSKDGGPLCEKPVTCGACKGGVTELELKYTGAGLGSGLVVKNKSGVIITRANANPILIKSDKLGTEIYITVGGKTTALHTSCSKPVYAGMKFGLNNVFEIVGGTSKDGGKLCNNYLTKKSAMIENIETIPEIHEFGVYPNPVLNIATVSFMPAYDGLATVELYNSLGQKAGSLLHQSVNKDVPVSFTFSGHKFKEGLYILILQNGDYRETAKIQISR